MQKTYVALKRVNLTFASFQVITGDILVYDPANNNKLTVFRNGKLMVTTSHTEVGMTSLIKLKVLSLVESEAAVPVAESGPAKADFAKKNEPDKENFAEKIATETIEVLDALIQTLSGTEKSNPDEVKAEAETQPEETKPESTNPEEIKPDIPASEATEEVVKVPVEAEAAPAEDGDKVEGETAPAEAHESLEEKAEELENGAEILGGIAEATGEFVAKDVAKDVAKVTGGRGRKSSK